MTKRDKTKDLLFNAIDYVVMIVIIIGIVIVLGYKFELLFNKGKVDTEVAHTKETTKEVNVTSNDIKENENSENNDKTTQNSENKDNTTENPDKITEETKPNEIIITDPNKNNETENTETKNNSDNKPAENKSQSTGEEVKINIPSGTLPGGMGDILANAGLVESKDAFVKKAVEMKLDRSLKSGEFVFKKGQSLEEILRILAK